MLKIFYFLIISLIFFNSVYAESVKIFEFTEKELSELEVRKVRGADNKTTYSVGSNENGNFLKAVADNAASGLGKQIKVNLNCKTLFEHRRPGNNLRFKMHLPVRSTRATISPLWGSNP